MSIITSGKVHEHLSLSHLMVAGGLNLCGVTGHLTGTRTDNPKYVNCPACLAKMAAEAK